MGDLSPPGVVPAPSELPAVFPQALGFEQQLGFGSPPDRGCVLEEVSQCIDEVQRQVRLHAGSSGARQRPDEPACLATQSNLSRSLDDALRLQRRLNVTELQWRSAEEGVVRAWEASSDCAIADTFSGVASELGEHDFAPSGEGPCSPIEPGGDGCAPGGEEPLPSLWATRPLASPTRPLSPDDSLADLPWVTPQADSERFPGQLELGRPQSPRSSSTHGMEGIDCRLDDADDTTDDNMAGAEDYNSASIGIESSERSSSLFDTWRSAKHRILGTLRLMGGRRRAASF